MTDFNAGTKLYLGIGGTGRRINYRSYNEELAYFGFQPSSRQFHSFIEAVFRSLEEKRYARRFLKLTPREIVELANRERDAYGKTLQARYRPRWCADAYEDGNLTLKDLRKRENTPPFVKGAFNNRIPTECVGDKREVPRDRDKRFRK